MNQRLFSIGVVIVVATFALSATSEAAPSTSSATAHFLSTDSAGIVSEVDVTITQGPGRSELFVEISRYRAGCPPYGCPQVVSYASEKFTVPNQALGISPSTGKAHVKTKTQVTNRGQNKKVDADFDLQWIATSGELPDEFWQARASGRLLVDGVNVTPNPSVDGLFEQW